MKEEERFVNESENPDGQVAFLRSHSCIHHAYYHTIVSRQKRKATIECVVFWELK